MAKSRRGQGEGCIRKRNDGRWVAILDLGYEVGKRKSKSFYGDSEAEVSAKLLEARSNYSKGLPVATGPQTVGQYLDHWLENTLRPNAKPRSYESFSAITRLHIKPNLGNIQLLKLAPQHIQKLLGDKTKAGLSAQTVTNIRTVLRSALTQAMKWGLVSRNVAALVDAPRIPHKDIKPLGPDDARALLAAARGSRYELAYILGLNLGLRRGEILGLRWSDIDLEKGSLRVSQSMQRLKTGSDARGHKSELRASETKSDGSRRTITLPESVQKGIRAHRARQLEDRLAAGLRWQGADLVFTNAIGKPLEPVLLHREYKKLLSAANLPSTLRFHDLRHSAASLLLAQGVHARAIMELLGHSSITVTMNVYGHVMPAMMREAANTMEALLGNR